VKTKT